MNPQRMVLVLSDAGLQTLHLAGCEKKITYAIIIMLIKAKILIQLIEGLHKNVRVTHEEVIAYSPHLYYYTQTFVMSA